MFSQVDEAKQELKDVVEFLRDAEKFQSLGAKLPKGVPLHVAVSALSVGRRPLADNSHFGPTVFSPNLAQSAQWADSHLVPGNRHLGSNQVCHAWSGRQESLSMARAIK